MKRCWYLLFAFLAGMALFRLFVPGEGRFVAAQSPQVATCNSSFEFAHAWGTTGSGPGQFQAPVAVAVDWDGHVHVVDRDNERIQKFDPGVAPPDNYLLEYGGEDDRTMVNPNGVEVGRNGYMYVAVTGQNRIEHYDASGTFIGLWRGVDGGSQWRMREPWGVTGWDYNHQGNVYVVDRYTCQILHFRSNGEFINDWGHCDPASYLPVAPQDAAAFPNYGSPPNFLYVADTGGNRVMKFDDQPAWLFNWGTPGTGNKQFNEPSSVATDKNGCVYVADTGNHRIQVFNAHEAQNEAEVQFITKFGSQGSGPGQLQGPRGVAVDPESGCVYVADTGNNRVVVFCPEPSPPPPTPTPRPADVFIKDNEPDTGMTPSDVPWVESPDIWVRHAPDGQESPEEIIPGQTNYIYVRLRNLGDIALEDVEVAVYWTCSGGDLPWPCPPGQSDLCWKLIASPHARVAGQSEAIIYVPWEVPSGNFCGHDDKACLLVRLNSAQDPIQSDSVPIDNNIAQNNVQILNWPGSGTPTTIYEVVTFLIGNSLTSAQFVDLEIDRRDFPTAGQLEIYLDQTLFDQWQADGGSVEGGTVNLAQKRIDITSTLLGVIKDIPLAAGQQALTTMRVTAASDQLFSVPVNELINGQYVGGNLYTTQYASHAEALDLSATTKIMPPGTTQMIIAYVFGPGKMPVKDGTTVNFSTTLGTVTPNQATTVGGIATVQLAAGETTGAAHVSATANGVVSEPLEITVGNQAYLPVVLKGS